jgi:hypothetical protein
MLAGDKSALLLNSRHSSHLADALIWHEECLIGVGCQMLRITIDQDDTMYRLKLAGRLCGPWVAETEDAWRSSPCPGKQIEIDMRDLTGIDDQGRQLLSAMYQAGARLVVEGVWMAAVVEEITRKQAIDAPTVQWQKKESSSRSIYREQEK